MIHRMLLAVDDTVDALAATRVALELARGPGRTLRVVHAGAQPALVEALRRGSTHPGAAARSDRAGAAVLDRVEAMARAARVDVGTALLAGEPGHAVLDEARRWSADLVVVGKSSRSASGEPYVGPVTRHILEFSEQPVLVVPASGGPGRGPRVMPSS
jgi:nucleotide-binding universal stress UspA family protein